MNPTTVDLTIDPYPELADSPLWSRVLPAAYVLAGWRDDSTSLLGLLHALRCLGAVLERKDGAVRLRAGSIDPKDYDRYRVLWLKRYDRELRQLFADLAETMQKLEAAS